MLRGYLWVPACAGTTGLRRENVAPADAGAQESAPS